MATADIIELDDSNTCKVCQNALGKYVCPKCNILYCSLSCYRSQSHQACSEQFYKDSVMEELKLNEKSPQDQLRMMSILKATDNSKVSDVLDYPNDDEQDISADDGEGMESCDSDDEKDCKSLHERLAGIDLDDAEQVWASLDEDERKDFIALTQDIKAKNIVQDWKPWWSYCINTKVQEVDFDTNVYKSKCPIVSDISKFQDICKQNPHISVKFNLYNILAGYVFVTRHFNGEYSLFPAETISFIAIISLGLQQHQNFMDFEGACDSVENQIMENEWITCEQHSLFDMVDDLKKLISGPEGDPNFYVLSALCDINSLLKKSLSRKEKDVDVIAKAFIDEHFPQSKIHTTKQIKLYNKRIQYFLSYVQNFYNK